MGWHSEIAHDKNPCRSVWSIRRCSDAKSFLLLVESGIQDIGNFTIPKPVGTALLLAS